MSKRSKQLKTTKTIKLQWIASIWRHNDKKCWVTSQCIQNNSKLQKRSNYNELHRFDVKTIKNLSYVAKHSKQRKTTKVIKLQWLASIWCQKDQKQRCKTKKHKTTKVIKLRQFASIWRQNDQKCWVTSQNIPNNAKLQKWSYNDEFASISCQNDQNNSKLQKRSNYNELHRFDVITIKNVELRRNAFKTTQNYKSDHHRFHVKTIKTTTTKTIKLQWIASIWRHNDKKCWVTSQCIQNNSKLQKRSNYNELHRFDWVTSQNIPNNAKLRKWSKYNYLHRLDVEKIKNVALSRKTSKQHQTTKVIKLQWIASIWRHNDKNVKLRRKTIKTTQNYKSDHITMNLHRFHVKTIKTTQNYKNDQITMNCIDLTS